MARPILALCCVLVLTACGAKEPAPPPAGSTSAVGADLTAFQLEHGIGPITTPVTLGPLDSKMAHEGKELFTAKCSACHKMTERYVGPPLGDVTIRRTPAFVMNQMLNPEGMYSKHPVVRQAARRIHDTDAQSGADRRSSERGGGVPADRGTRYNRQLNSRHFGEA